MQNSLKGQLAFAYLRISDDVEGKKLGVERQDEDIRELAADLGVTLVRIYCDNDISASTNSTEYRPDYEDMVTQLEAGPVKMVLAYTKNRLTRKPEENERLIKLARFHGVEYRYVRGHSLDLRVSANRKMDRIQAAIDAGMPEDLQELVLRKKLADAREGKTSGGRRTYGYGKVVGHNPINGKDICDPYQVREVEISVLQEGKRRTLAGDSQFAIIQDWKTRGITSSTGNDWRVGTFKRALLNEAYVEFDPTGHPTDCLCLKNSETGGTRVHHEERHRAKWPFVFTRAEHDAMVSMFNGRSSAWSNKGKLRGRTYLLSGFTECGGIWRDTEKKGEVCGGVMRGQGKSYPLKSGNTTSVRRYACKKWDRDGSRLGCCSVFRVADQVEAHVTEQVLYRFDSPKVFEALAPAENELRMAEVVQQLAELQARREVLAAEYAAGEHEKDDYRVMMQSIKDKFAVAETEKKHLLSAKAKKLALPTDGGLRELWKTASMEWRSSVIRLVVEKVVIHPTLRGGKFNPDDVEIVWLH